MVKTRFRQRVTKVLGAILLVSAIFGCRQAPEKKLAGTWAWKSCDDAGEITYQKDHTFISREWGISHTQQPPILFDSGDWHVNDGQLILNFKGQTRPPGARHLVVSFILLGEDILVVHAPDGLIRTFERSGSGEVSPHY